MGEAVEEEFGFGPGITYTVTKEPVFTPYHRLKCDVRAVKQHHPYVICATYFSLANMSPYTYPTCVPFS